MDGLIRLLYNFKFTVFGVELDSGNLIGSVQQLTNFSRVQNINICMYFGYQPIWTYF